jgi:cytochrome P450
MWAVSRYGDVLGVLKDTQRFSSGAIAGTRKPPWLERNAFGDTNVVAMDPPEHSKMRSLISPAFTAAAMARLESYVRDIAEDLAERAVRKGEVDFIDEFAIPLPGTVICQMLGLDRSLHREFKRWTQDTLLLVSGAVSGAQTPEQIARIQASLDAMERYFGEVIEARRRAPKDDMVSDLLLSRVDGAALTHAELLGFLRVLLLAGLETTSALLGNAMIILEDHPEVAAHVCADPVLVPAFIEEVLRYESPAQSSFRRAAAGAAIDGTPLPEGAMVLVLLGSAQRDERHFRDADRFLLDRGKEGNLSFGHGIHFCVGAALARMEARLGLSAILSRVRRFSRMEREIAWAPSLSVRGPAALPIRFEVGGWRQR